MLAEQPGRRGAAARRPDRLARGDRRAGRARAGLPRRRRRPQGGLPPETELFTVQRRRRADLRLPRRAARAGGAAARPAARRRSRGRRFGDAAREPPRRSCTSTSSTTTRRIWHEAGPGRAGQRQPLPPARRPARPRASRSSRRSTRPSQMREMPDADGVYGWPSAAVLARATKLRWLQSPSAGVERIWALPDLQRSEVVITNARGATRSTWPSTSSR